MKAPEIVAAEQHQDSESSDDDIYCDGASEFDCIVCMELMIEPIKLNCGHNYCKQCFQRFAMQRAECPYCKRFIHSGCYQIDKEMQVKLMQKHPKEFKAGLRKVLEKLR